MFQLARFFTSLALPVRLPGWMYALIAGAVLGAWGANRVTAGYYHSQESTAWQEQVDRLKAQADKDRAKLAERDKRLAEIDNAAAKGRQRYKDAVAGNPAILDWSNQRHPADTVRLLNSARADLLGNGHP